MSRVQIAAGRVSRVRIPALVLTADVVAVVVFAALGRLSHGEEGLVGLVTTAAPFLVGAVAAWATPWVRDPPVGLRAGVVAVGVTTAVGTLMRWGWNGAFPAWPFPLVTLLTLAVLMLGWRGLAVLSRSHAARHSPRR